MRYGQLYYFFIISSVGIFLLGSLYLIANSNQQTTSLDSRSFANNPQITASPTASPSPSYTPFPAVTPTLLPTIVPTRVPTLIPTKPPITVSSLTGAVNNYRNSLGMGNLLEHGQLCVFAQTRAAEAVGDFSHAGFQQKIDSGELRSLGYRSIAENLWTASYAAAPSEITNAWHGSDGHRKNLQGDFNYGCGAWSGNTVAYLFMKK